MGLRLFFLPNIPGATFIKGATFIPDSRVYMKNWIFDDPFNNKITSVGYFGASDDQIIRIRKLFWEIRL